MYPSVALAVYTLNFSYSQARPVKPDLVKIIEWICHTQLI